MVYWSYSAHQIALIAVRINPEGQRISLLQLLLKHPVNKSESMRTSLELLISKKLANYLFPAAWLPRGAKTSGPRGSFKSKYAQQNCISELLETINGYSS